MKRLADFLRSVVPEDATQLIFLGGVVCLLVAPHLRWWPQEMIPGSLNDLLNRQVFGEQTRRDWGRFLSLAVWPVIFSGIAGYFVPDKRAMWNTTMIRMNREMMMSLSSQSFSSTFSLKSIWTRNGLRATMIPQKMMHRIDSLLKFR